MVAARPYIPAGKYFNRDVRLFNNQRLALRAAILRCIDRNLPRGELVGLNPKPWHKIWSDYRGSGLRFGEFVVCAYATGEALGIGQGYGNRNIGAPMSAGFDFIYKQIHIEVKTLYGNVTTISDISQSQWDSAHVFVLYNRDRGPRNFRGIEIPGHCVCVISNDRMRTIMGF